MVNSAATVSANTSWTPLSTNYLNANTSTNFVVESLYCSRDEEVDTWTRDGTVFERLTTNGDAIYFTHNGNTTNGYLEIGFVTGLNQSGGGTYYPLYENSNLVGTFSGYSTTNTTGAVFAFGVSGFTIYVNFNGNPVVNFLMPSAALGPTPTQSFMQAGAIALLNPSTSYGFRNITVAHLQTAALFSDYTNDQIDLRDFGVRTTPFATSFTGGIGAQFKGSISNGSGAAGTTLAVASIQDGVICNGDVLQSGAPVLVNTSAASASGTTITFASGTIPPAVAVGMQVSDVSTSAAIPAGTFVTALTSTTATLSQSVTNVGLGDFISFYEGVLPNTTIAVSGGGCSSATGNYTVSNSQWVSTTTTAMVTNSAVLDVTAVSRGALSSPGMTLFPASVAGSGDDIALALGTQVNSQISGTTGGIGFYTISQPQNIAAAIINGVFGETTGSIAAGTNSLTLNGANDFIVGDWIIVQIGSESGLGVRGTMGVGGSWPALNYSTTAALQADTTQAVNTYAWAQDTGDVWQFQTITGSISATALTVTVGVSGGQPIAIGTAINGPGVTAGTKVTAVLGGGQYSVNNSQTISSQGLTVWAQVQNSQWYATMALPQSLQAQITAISGSTLTLSQNAAATATNAAVFLDNGPLVNYITQRAVDVFPADLTPITPGGVQIKWPNGIVSFGGEVILQTHPGWTIAGYGKFASLMFSPNGIRPTSILSQNSPNSSIRDIGIIGNEGQLNYFGLSVNASYNNQPTTIVPGGLAANGHVVPQFFSGVPSSTQVLVAHTLGLPYGFSFGDGDDDSIMRDVLAVNFINSAINVFECNNCWVYNGIVYSWISPQVYSQWEIIWVNTTGGGCVDCKYVSPAVIASGMSCFGSVDCSYIRPVVYNGVIEFNADSGSTYVDHPKITENAPLSPSASINIPMLNLDSNTGPSNGNATVVAPYFYQPNYLDSNNDNLTGMIISSQNPNVSILGGYYFAPNYASPSTVFGANAITSQGFNAKIDSFTELGGASPSWHSIYAYTPGSTAITNTTAANNDIVNAGTQNGSNLVGSVNNGLTTTKTAGSCIFTFTGGSMTSVSGC